MESQNEKAVGLTTSEEENRSLLQGFFLSRMRGFLFLSQEPALAYWEQTLVKRAIYSTYLDCVSVGLVDDARALLQGMDSGTTTRALVVRN